LSRVLVPKKTEQHWQVAKHVQIEGNATQLQQILLNLLKNACDAVKDVDQPQISVSLSAVEANQVAPEHVELTAERYAKLSVKDNGCGISARHREHIFDPFFTTKDIGEGTGMGLAMIYGAVQSHRGWIEVDSNEGQGAEFRLFFPMADHIETDSQAGDADKPMLLLVDDEPQVLSLGAEVLKALGYDVVTSDNGEDALNLFQKEPGRFAVAVLDVMMPRMNGTETAAALRRIRPALPILFVTGYDQNAVSADLLSQPGIALLHKPWKVESMEDMLRDLLAAAT